MEIEMEESGGGGVGGGALHSTESDVDLAAMAEKEYQRMKRQYFLMQRNRQSLVDKAGSKMAAKSSKLIKVLENHKEDLESNISAATSANNQRKDEITKEKIWTLLQVFEKYKNQATFLNREIESMERNLIKMTAKFYKAKLIIQARIGHGCSIGSLERIIDNNENKLHLLKSNTDMLMTENNVLKDEIGIKIQRRLHIFNRLDNLHWRMNDCRHDLTAKVDESLQIYNIWDDAHKRINFIREKYKEDVRQHILEVKEYDRLLFHDLREIRFYSIKNKPRSLVEHEAQREAMQSQNEIRELLRDIRAYQKQFKRLEEFDPSLDVDTIISKYEALEQKNFGDFQQISDFNQENIKLMEEIHELKAEIDALASDKTHLTLANQSDLMSIQLNHDAEQEKLEFLQAQLDINDASAQKIFESIEAFMETAECDVEPLSQLLGSTTKVTKDNLKAAFNLLEHHITSIILERELLVIQTDVEASNSPGGGAGAGGKKESTKQHRAQGGPFEAKLVISGHPELGMEKKDEEGNMLGISPLPKSVQRELLLQQLRDSGVIAPARQLNTNESSGDLAGTSGGAQAESSKSAGSSKAASVDVRASTSKSSGSGSVGGGGGVKSMTTEPGTGGESSEAEASASTPQGPPPTEGDDTATDSGAAENENTRNRRQSKVTFEDEGSPDASDDGDAEDT